MTNKRQAMALVLLAVLSELFILTDFIAGGIGSFITTDFIYQRIVTFGMVYGFWIAGIFIIRKLYQNNEAIHFSHTEAPTVKHWIFGLLLLAISLIVSYISWDGFKVVKELMGGINNAGLGLGIAYFNTQYIYYFLETILFFNIIKYSQQAGELLFSKGFIPYGGVALAVLWGLPHIISQGLVDGAIITLRSVLMGIAYLVVRKNPKAAFVLILFMFIF